MRLFHHLIFVFALLAAMSVSAASREEANAFKSAQKALIDRIFYIAENDFATFVQKFPGSEHRAEAILFQAQARYHQTNYVGAIELLTKELPQAGVLADRYQLWIGESHFAAGSFELAAKSYREILRSIRPSPLRLEAAYNEALSYSKLNDWPRVIELLGKMDADFQQAAKAQPESDFALNGNLLLAEALVAKSEFASAETALRSASGQHLSPVNAWRREFLTTKILIAQSRLTAALEGSTNLVQLASRVGSRNAVGESFALQAEIFEKLNRHREAIEAYEKNLAEGLPTDLRRGALFKIIELTLARGKTADASARLQTFLIQNPNDSARDVALVSLGELQLKEYFEATVGRTNGAAIVAQTNLLQQALTNFITVQANYPDSPLLGKALLNIGWCMWVQGQVEEAAKSFADAVRTLRPSEEKAIALFKLADCQFKRGDFTNAAANYSLVISDFSAFAGIKNVLLDQALYQVVRSAIATTNQALAESAAQKILTLYPNSFFADRSLLLFGQDLNRQLKPAEARKVLSDLLNRFPTSVLRPDAELAIARTFVQEKQWPRAIAAFESWEAKYTNHALIPDAEFSRALVYAQAGQETNTLTLLTNFVARFGTNMLAARAENWLGDYYFNLEEYPKAEEHYQGIVKLNPAPELLSEAYLMAGRSAYARQGYVEARKNYFEPLITSTKTPTNILAEAFFGLGDTLFAEFLQSTNEDLLSSAISAMNQAMKNSANSALVARAWGRIGDLHLQSALIRTNSADFAAARDAYQNSAASEFADVACRNQAQVGIGKVFERQGEIVSALEQYLKVVYAEDEQPSDPFWVKEAGLAAGKILETRGEWESVVRLYRRMSQALPPLASILDKKIAVAEAQLSTSGTK